MKPKILIDRDIPFIQGVLDPLAEVCYLPAKAITPEACHDAKALIIRTRTACNQDLLEGSQVELIASATVGTDHINRDFCKTNNIAVANAPGCNAWAVVQWVTSALYLVTRQLPIPLSQLRIGIVGCGAVGRRLHATLTTLGIHTILVDPPLQAQGGKGYTSLAMVQQFCDIITFHVPLTYSDESRHPTYHLADEHFFYGLERRPFILNSSRGGVVDDYALLRALERKQIRGYCLDVYENEQDVSPALLEPALLSTPHIAGYSIEGKQAATAAVLQAVCSHFGWPKLLPKLEVDETQRPFNAGLSISDLAKTYDIRKDSLALKAQPYALEQLRSHYTYRHDWQAYEFGNRKLSIQDPLG